MRVLLDEQLPRQLARHLPGHEIRTVQQQSKAGLKNGALLTEAGRAGFSVFITGDRNLEYQQNLTHEDLLPLVPEVLTAIERVQPGQVLRVPERDDRRHLVPPHR